MSDFRSSHGGPNRGSYSKDTYGSSSGDRSREDNYYSDSDNGQDMRSSRRSHDRHSGNRDYMRSYRERETARLEEERRSASPRADKRPDPTRERGDTRRSDNRRPDTRRDEVSDVKKLSTDELKSKIVRREERMKTAQSKLRALYTNQARYDENISGWTRSEREALDDLRELEDIYHRGGYWHERDAARYDYRINQAKNAIGENNGALAEVRRDIAINEDTVRRASRDLDVFRRDLNRRSQMEQPREQSRQEKLSWTRAINKIKETEEAGTLCENIHQHTSYLEEDTQNYVDYHANFPTHSEGLNTIAGRLRATYTFIDSNLTPLQGRLDNGQVSRKNVQSVQNYMVYAKSRINDCVRQMIEKGVDIRQGGDNMLASYTTTAGDNMLASYTTTAGDNMLASYTTTTGDDTGGYVFHEEKRVFSPNNFDVAED